MAGNDNYFSSDFSCLNVPYFHVSWYCQCCTVAQHWNSSCKPHQSLLETHQFLVCACTLHASGRSGYHPLRQSNYRHDPETHDTRESILSVTITELVLRVIKLAIKVQRRH